MPIKIQKISDAIVFSLFLQTDRGNSYPDKQDNIKILRGVMLIL